MNFFLMTPSLYFELLVILDPETKKLLSSTQRSLSEHRANLCPLQRTQVASLIGCWVFPDFPPFSVSSFAFRSLAVAFCHCPCTCLCSAELQPLKDTPARCHFILQKAFCQWDQQGISRWELALDYQGAQNHHRSPYERWAGESEVPKTLSLLVYEETPSQGLQAASKRRKSG